MPYERGVARLWGISRAYVFLALAMSIAGSAVVVGKMMVASLPIFLAAWLGILVSLFFLLPLLWRDRNLLSNLDKRTHLVLLAQALFGVVFYRVFIFFGLRYTSATAGALISSAAPALIALMAFFVLHEKMPGRRIAGLVSVSIGILLVNILPFLESSFAATDAIKGNALVLLAVICESIFSVLSKFECRPMSAMFRTALVSLYAFFCLLPFALYEAVFSGVGAINMASMLYIGYYGFFVSFLSYVFWFKGVMEVPVGTAGAFIGFVPISGLLLSWLLLNETITLMHWLGLVSILLGVFLACAVKK